MLNGKTFTCKAYAKINLFLNVFNKTKDNLHNLKSLVCFVDLYDEIVISNSKRQSAIIDQSLIYQNIRNTKYKLFFKLVPVFEQIEI